MKKLFLMTAIIILGIGTSLGSKPNYLRNIDLSSITKKEEAVNDVIPSNDYSDIDLVDNQFDLSDISKPEQEVNDEIPSNVDIQNFLLKNFNENKFNGIVYMYLVNHDDESFIVIVSDNSELKKYIENKLLLIENDLKNIFNLNNISSLSINFKYIK